MPNVNTDPVGPIDAVDQTGVAGVLHAAGDQVSARSEAHAASQHTTGVRTATSKG